MGQGTALLPNAVWGLTLVFENLLSGDNTLLLSIYSKHKEIFILKAAFYN